jgi:tetratricopeptide (TPR) repeat protein
VNLRLTATLAVLLAGTPATAATTSEEEARRHYDLGQRHFNLGEFDGAIDEFKQAYEISPVPGLLFNIAQAYRAKKDNERALYFYQTYLREEPQASERPYVEQRIEELRASEDSRKQVEAAAAHPQNGDNDVGRRRLRLAGVIVGGSGLAIAGASVIFGIRAAMAASDVTDALGMGMGPGGGHWTPELAARWSEGQKYQTASWVLGAIGIGAVATGGILYYLGTREHPVSVSAAATAGGGGLSIKSTF